MSQKTQALKLGLSFLSLIVGQIIFPNSIFAQTIPVIAKNSPELPIVSSAVLNTDINVPWSQPVKVRDSFEGEFIAIFDRNYFFQYFINKFARIDVISLWRQDSIQMLVALSNRDCWAGTTFYAGFWGSQCNLANGTQAIARLFIKLGDQVFELEGQNSVFKVNEELASALRQSPVESINIRLITASGAAIDSEIGKGTVEAWKAIY